MVRPWVGGLAMVLCALVWLGALACHVDFQPAQVLEGLGRAADVTGLEGIAIALHLEAADAYRSQVRELRVQGAPATDRKAVRFTLAEQLKAAGLMLRGQGDFQAAVHYLDAAAKAAPERLDLKCLLLEARVKAGEEPDLRLGLLRLAYHHDAPCAHYLLGRMFFESNRIDEAVAYLERATEKGPRHSGAHLLLARIRLDQSDHAGALVSASQAYDRARNLQEKLAAAALIDRAGGQVRSRAALTAEAYWQRYRYPAITPVALVIFLFHPAIGQALRRRRGRV